MAEGSVFQRFPVRLQRAIVSRLGWSSLRPVQEAAGEALLAGHNAVVLAPTAGGKTEAAMFPVLAGLMAEPPAGVGALYIAPIKALLNNQAGRLGQYTEMVGLDRFLWHGDVSAPHKARFKASPTALLMTTPESLEVMLISEKVSVRALFSELRWVVVDEVHALAGTDRGAHLMSVLERVAAVSRHDVQRVGLSATVGNPAAIAAWLSGSSRRQAVVVDPPTPPAPRSIRVLALDGEAAIAEAATREATGYKSLLFCQSRRLSEALAASMERAQVDVFVHHSSVSLEERQAAEARFERGANTCIVCTSTLELGIDVGDLDKVLQANAPTTVSSFLQRMGRTGRRPGQVANTAFLCEGPEAVLQAVAIVELARQRWVEPVVVQPRSWAVLVHQLMAMTLERGERTADELWSLLSRVPDFAGIARAEFDALIAHLLAGGWLGWSGRSLLMGLEAERMFGRKNFAELYAVFSSPVQYAVKDGNGRPIGSLEQAFVDRLEEDGSSFVLSGRAWWVRQIDHKARLVRVVPASGGQKPGWGGMAPNILGFELCQQMKAILVGTTVPGYLNAAAKDAITGLRDELAETLAGPGLALQVGSDEAVWWTFAGGRINHTLRYGLALAGGWKATADNQKVSVMGEGVSFGAVEAAIAALRTRAFWEDPARRRRLLASLPEYRLSKFQPLLPERWSVELVAGFLLDVEGTLAFLAGADPSVGSQGPGRDRSAGSTIPGAEPAEAAPEAEVGPEARFATHLPLYDLEAFAASAPAGEWGAAAVDAVVEPVGWLPVQLKRRLTARMFVAAICGSSMDDGRSGLVDGGLAVFEVEPRGTRQHRIVLVRGSFSDPETGSFAVKRYVADARGADGRHGEIRLVSLHPDKERYPDIVLDPEDDDALTVVATLVEALPGRRVRSSAPPPVAVESAEALAARRQAEAVARAQAALARASVEGEEVARERAEAAEAGGAWAWRPSVGLCVEFGALPSLLPFIAALDVRTTAGLARVPAGNVRHGRWWVAMRPSAEPVEVVAVDFERDADVQRTLPGAVDGLSATEVTVFALDADGLGRQRAGRAVRRGERCGLLVPPARVGEVGGRGEGVVGDGAWRWWVVEVGAAEVGRLEGLGVAVTVGGVRARLATGARRVVGGQAWFGRGDVPLVRVESDAAEGLGVVLVGPGRQETAQVAGAGGLLALEGLEVGRYVLEAFVVEGAHARLTFEVAEEVEAPVPSAVVAVELAPGVSGRRSKKVVVEGRKVVLLDLERAMASLGTVEGAGAVRVSGPPLWPVMARWRGLRTARVGAFGLDAAGSLDVGAVLRACRHLVTDHARGDLELSFGELGELVLGHERSLNVRVGELREQLGRVRRGLSQALGAGDLRRLWLEQVAGVLGYGMVPTSVVSEEPEVLECLGLTAYRRVGGEGEVFPAALLVVVEPGHDLLDLGPADLLARAGGLHEGTPYPRALVTDGRVWNSYVAGQQLRRRPLDMDEVLADAQGLAFEELLQRLGAVA